MSGSLIKIAETTVSSATAQVILTGIDTTYDVYKVVLNDVQGDTDTVSMQERFTVSGTPQTTANYDYSAKTLRDNSTFQNNAGTNMTGIPVNTQTAMGTGTGETLQGVRYYHNFTQSGKYSFMTMEMVFRDFDGSSRGGQGGALYSVNEVHDGVAFFFLSGNIVSGSFVLYGLKKS